MLVTAYECYCESWFIVIAYVIIYDILLFIIIYTVYVSESFHDIYIVYRRTTGLQAMEISSVFVLPGE